MYVAPLLIALLAAQGSAQEAIPAPPGASVAPAPKGPAGTWVPAELRRALAADRPVPLPCWIEVAPDLAARERCPDGARDWGTGVRSEGRPGATTLAYPGGRELVHRGGTPDELEVIEGDPSGEGYRRLYRLSLALEPELANWAAAERLVKGPFRTADGASIVFGTDGRYTFEFEVGAYRVELDPAVPGTAGILVLAPDGGPVRRYFLIPGPGGTALAPVPPDFPPPPPPPEPEPPSWAPAGSAGGAAVDLGALARPPPRAGASLPDEVDRELDDAAGAPPRDAGSPQPATSWTGPLPAPEIVLVPAEPPAPVTPEPVVPPGPGTPPPIAQPLEPRARCGCAASDAAVSGLLASLLALTSRRKHHRRR